MKILYVITGLGTGGAERVVVNLAEKMHSLGNEVEIIYLRGKAETIPKYEAIKITNIGLEKYSDLLKACYNFRKEFKKFNPEVIHAHMVHANIFCRINRIFNRIPKLVCTAHSSNEGGRLRMLAYRFTNFLSDINTNVSKEALNSFIQKKAFKKNNSFVVYNGIDTSIFCEKEKNKFNPEGDTIFLSVGRLTEQKDYPNLLGAIELFKKKSIISNMKFLIVGEGELEDELKEEVNKLKIQDYVSFLGKRTNIPELLNSADFFILSSKYEGFGLVVAEAMSCGTYTIATNCGGVAEVMGNTGILVSPGNSEALADAVTKAISLPHNKIIENNKKAKQRIVDLFSLDKIINQWVKIYND